VLESEEDINYATQDSPHKQPLPREIRNKILDHEVPDADEANRSLVLEDEIDERI